jgi:hypothetical protein
MQTIQKYRIQGIGPVKVYLDDLDSIVSALQELGPNVTIRTEDAAVLYVDALRQDDGQPFHRLTIATANVTPSLQVELAPDRAEIRLADEEHALGRGVQDKVEQLLAGCRQPLMPLLNIWLPVALTLVLTVAFWARDIGDMGLVLLAVTTMIVWATWSLLYRQVHTQIHSIIVPQYRGDAATYYERNRERVDIALAAGITGIVVGVVATLATRAM